MNQYWVGCLGGVVATAIMYASLVPVMRGGPSPPAQIVSRIARMRPESARLGGYALQVAFGLFWGLVAAYWNTIYFPIRGSYLAQGLLWGLAAFTMSLLAFATLGLMVRPMDWTRWAGYLLSHLMFGAALGVMFFFAGTPSA